MIAEEGRKVEFFDDVLEKIDDKRKIDINLVDEIINFDGKNEEKFFEIFEKSGKSVQFIFKCIEYLMSIRPTKMELLFSLFCIVAKKKGYEYFTPITETLRKLLICEGFIQSNGEHESKEDILCMYPAGSVERAIKDDDVDLFIQLSSQPGFDPKKGVKITKDSILYGIRGEQNITYLQFMAFFGAEKCFKRAFQSGMYPFPYLNYYAIAGGNYEVIQTIRSKLPKCFDGCFEISVRFHHYDVSDWLLRNNKCEEVSQTTCLCYYNYIAYNFFVENGIDVQPKFFDGNIVRAAKVENFPNIYYIVERCNFDINQKNNEGWTALHWAANNGNMLIVQYLLEHGANIDQTDGEGWTALLYATLKGHLYVVQYLVEHGANVNQANSEEQCPLHIASSEGFLDVVQYLFEHGANYDKKDDHGNNALHSAAYEGHLDVVKFFVEHGAYIDPLNDKRKTPLNTAAVNSHIDVIKYLFDHGADINTVDKTGYTPLHSVAAKGSIEGVKYLIENGANVNQGDEDGCIALHLAALNGHVDVVQYLFEHGEDINQEDSSGYTPLHWTTSQGNLGVVKFLVENGADVNKKDCDERTALHLSTVYKHLEIIQYLVEHGANINQKDSEGYTALSIAKSSKSTEIMKYLKSKGAK